MRVLVTNDDGIDSPGIAALAAVARDRGHDTLVAAPSWDSSGASAAVTGVSEARRLVAEPRSWPGWPRDGVLAVNATPALICWSAIRGELGAPPDVVLSGINRGANTGRAILHSGTVGAAFTAYQHRRPALAVSLAVLEPVDPARAHWETAAGIAGWLFDWLIGAGRPMALNCNVPDVPRQGLRGVRVARLAPVGAVRSAITEPTGGTVPLEIGGSSGLTNGSGRGANAETDTDLVWQGFACVTAVVPVVEDPDVDLYGVIGQGMPAGF